MDREGEILHSPERVDLQTFLRGRSNLEGKKHKEKSVKIQIEKEKEKAKRSRPDTADTAKTAESGTSTSSRRKKGKRRKKQHAELKAQIEEKKDELRELLGRLRKLKEDENHGVDATAMAPTLANRPQADESVCQMQQPIEKITLSYILNGRAGKFTKDLSVLTLSDLEEGLLPLDDDQQKSKDEMNRKKANFKHCKFGATSCWAPKAASVVGTNLLTKLKKKAKIVDELDAFFESKQCAFSQQALRILTMYTSLP